MLDWLPALAVPRKFKFLEEIPKSSNGKADARMLREFSYKTNEPDKLEIFYDYGYYPIIVGLCKNILNEEKLAPNFDLFAIGGHYQR